MKLLKNKKISQILAPLIATVILCVALALLYNALREYRFKDLVNALRNYSKSTLLLAFALTIANYLELSLYDFTALQFLKQKISYAKSLFVSYIGYVFSYNIGMSIFGSSAVRIRFYSMWGVDGGTIARIITFCVTAFWVGLAALGGVTLALGPAPQTAYPAFNTMAQVLGYVLIAATILYLAACASGKASISIRRFTLSLPSLKFGIAQICIASLDLLLTSSPLYALLPAGRPSFIRFFTIFIVAQVASYSSFVPGGVGVLETVLVLSLSSYMSPTDIFSALLVYRGIFYLFPLAVAIVVFSTREIWAKWKKTSELTEATVSIFPSLIAKMTFIAGAALLVFAALPLRLGSFDKIKHFYPLFMLEISHLGSCLVGFMLILASDGLRRRVVKAYYTTVGLLVAGIVFSVGKAFSLKELIVLVPLLVIMLLSRSYFYRRSFLFSKPDSWSLFAIGAVLAACAWLTAFSSKHLTYSTSLWLTFGYNQHAPRMLRAGIGMVLCSLGVLLRLYLSRRPILTQETFAQHENTVLKILEKNSSANAYLALFGNKYFHFSADATAFVVYTIVGKTCVVIGNPAGNRDSFEDMLWDFCDRSRSQGLSIVWYGLSSPELPVFVESGLKVRKIGEEALVDLTDTAHVLSIGKSLEPKFSAAREAGYTFQVLSPAEIKKRWSELKTLSDQWVAEQQAKEAQFTLDDLSEHYLMRFNCAVIEKANKICAFASIWTSGNKQEASLDLLRCVENNNCGISELIFYQTIDWAQKNGFQTFSLGIAPHQAPDVKHALMFWRRASPLLGEAEDADTSVQKLREFKEQFEPTWYPRYLVSNSGDVLTLLEMQIALFISKGSRIEEKKSIYFIPTGKAE